MRMIRQITRVGAKTQTAQDAQGATIVTAVDLQVPLIFNVRAPPSTVAEASIMLNFFAPFSVRWNPCPPY